MMGMQMQDRNRRANLEQERLRELERQTLAAETEAAKTPQQRKDEAEIDTIRRNMNALLGFDICYAARVAYTIRVFMKIKTYANMLYVPRNDLACAFILIDTDEMTFLKQNDGTPPPVSLTNKVKRLQEWLKLFDALNAITDWQHTFTVTGVDQSYTMAVESNNFI